MEKINGFQSDDNILFFNVGSSYTGGLGNAESYKLTTCVLLCMDINLNNKIYLKKYCFLKSIQDTYNTKQAKECCDFFKAYTMYPEIF